jgi:uncharacterized protein YbjQ (UPF0145 family)
VGKRGTEIACPQCQNTIQIPASCPVEPPPLLPQIEAKPALRAIDLASSPRERQLLIITTTGNEVSGQQIERYLGIARGIVVRSPSGSESLFGGLKQIMGGNIETYARLCDPARQEAFARMIAHANDMKADAVPAASLVPAINRVLADRPQTVWLVRIGEIGHLNCAFF